MSRLRNRPKLCKPGDSRVRHGQRVCKLWLKPFDNNRSYDISGHHATLTTTLVQAAESTTIRLELDGVPKGQEDEIQRNLQGY
jgi:hypothetical protein